jgi:ribosomal protein S18 acetylase RimI-like enzyme
VTDRGTFVVREAGPDDLEPIVAIFLACWRRSYASFLPEGVIGIYDDTSARALWEPTLDNADAARVTLVAVRADGEVLGVVSMGADPDESACGHIYSLYVQPDAQGLGVGAGLMEASVRKFRDQRVECATLWVFEANQPARRFYRRLGWSPDGSARIEELYGAPQVRLRRTL